MTTFMTTIILSTMLMYEHDKRKNLIFKVNFIYISFYLLRCVMGCMM